MKNRCSISVLILIAISLVAPPLVLGAECGLPKDLTVTQFTSSSETVQQTLLSLLSKSTHKESSDRLGADFVFNKIPINVSSTSFSNFQQSLQSSSYAKTLISRSSQIIQSHGDPQLVEAFRECIGAQSPIHVRVFEGSRVVRFEISYRAQPAETYSAKINKMTDLTKSGMHIEFDSCAQTNTIPPRGSCTVSAVLPTDVDLEVLFDVNTNKGEAHAYIPPRRSLAVSSASPIPHKYMQIGDSTPMASIEVGAIGNSVSIAKGCTGPLPNNAFIVVTKDHPTVLPSAHPNFPGMEAWDGQVVATPLGLQSRVCFEYKCRWPGKFGPGERRWCSGVLNGSLTQIEWKPR